MKDFTKIKTKKENNRAEDMKTCNGEMGSKFHVQNQ